MTKKTSIRKEFEEAKKIVTEFARTRARDNTISHITTGQHEYDPKAIKVLESLSDGELRDIKILYDESFTEKANYFKGEAYTPNYD